MRKEYDATERSPLVQVRRQLCAFGTGLGMRLHLKSKTSTEESHTSKSGLLTDESIGFQAEVPVIVLVRRERRERGNRVGLVVDTKRDGFIVSSMS